MRAVVWTNAFKKDYKLISKRHLNTGKLRVVVEALANDVALPESARPHKLVGNYIGTWECHIEADWLLIYEYAENELILRRTGTHTDLFR